MPRIEISGNTQFVSYVGPPSLQPKQDLSQGDPNVRTMGGKKIISVRGRLVNRAAGNRFDPPEEAKLEVNARYQSVLNDSGLHQPPTASSSMWA